MDRGAVRKRIVPKWDEGAGHLTSGAGSERGGRRGSQGVDLKSLRRTATLEEHLLQRKEGGDRRWERVVTPWERRHCQLKTVFRMFRAGWPRIG